MKSPILAHVLREEFIYFQTQNRTLIETCKIKKCTNTFLGNRSPPDSTQAIHKNAA